MVGGWAWRGFSVMNISWSMTVMGEGRRMRVRIVCERGLVDQSSMRYGGWAMSVRCERRQDISGWTLSQHSHSFSLSVDS